MFPALCILIVITDILLQSTLQLDSSIAESQEDIRKSARCSVQLIQNGARKIQERRWRNSIAQSAFRKFCHINIGKSFFSQVWIKSEQEPSIFPKNSLTDKLYKVSLAAAGRPSHQDVDVA